MRSFGHFNCSGSRTDGVDGVGHCHARPKTHHLQALDRRRPEQDAEPQPARWRVPRATPGAPPLELFTRDDRGSRFCPVRGQLMHQIHGRGDALEVVQLSSSSAWTTARARR